MMRFVQRCYKIILKQFLTLLDSFFVRRRCEKQWPIACSTPKGPSLSLARVIVLCFWARHFTLTVSLHPGV